MQGTPFKIGLLLAMALWSVAALAQPADSVLAKAKSSGTL
jgi:hypothetical protein